MYVSHFWLSFTYVLFYETAMQLVQRSLDSGFPVLISLLLFLFPTFLCYPPAPEVHIKESGFPSWLLYSVAVQCDQVAFTLWASVSSSIEC